MSCRATRACRSSGVVTNVEAMHEGARFASDVFLIQQGALPAEVCEVAEVTVTRVEPEMYVPPMPGAPVMRAAGAQRDSALYFDEMGASKVPVGFGRDGQPVFVNFEFIDGTRGAHVSISGVSGIATKTSFAMFLLHSITNCGVLAGEAHNTKALVFSVKGEDLLFLDYANSRLTAGSAGALRQARAARGAVRQRAGVRPAARGTTRRARLTYPPATGRSARSTGRWRSSASRSCCRSCSPTPRTSGPSTRC